jgi:hypothetical protein
MTAVRMIGLPIAAGDMIAGGTLIIRPYDPRPKRGHGGRGIILLVAGLLGFIFVVSHAQHYLNSDESPNTIIASAVPPERTAAPATRRSVDHW